LVVLEGTLDSVGYVRLLSENLFDSVDLMHLGLDFIFQQDNAPCHVSRHTMQFFTTNEIKLLEWPSQSPDLNPIEHVWAFMKKKLGKMIIKNKTELIQQVRAVWSSIPREFIRNLIDSMPRRIEEVVRARGGTTSY
jgi:DDE superfamily endonuclease